MAAMNVQITSWLGAVCLATWMLLASTIGFAQTHAGADTPEILQAGTREAILFERYRAAWGLRGADMRVASSLDVHGFHVVRYQRFVRGLAVLHAEALIRVAPNGLVDWTWNDASGAEPNYPSLSRPARADATFVYYRLANGNIVPAFSYVDSNIARLQATLFVVHAESGSVLLRESLLRDFRGSVYASGSARMNLQEVELPALTVATGLDGQGIAVHSATVNVRNGENTQSRHALPDTMGNYTDQPITSGSIETRVEDGFAEVNVYYHTAFMTERLRAEHGYTWNCTGNAFPARMDVFANVVLTQGGRLASFDNAAYAPPRSFGNPCGIMVFGEGTLFDFGYDPDIAYHELGHAVMDQISDLGVSESDAFGVRSTPGAINEGTSDYWAASMSGDPVVAESLEALSEVTERIELARRTDLNIDATRDQTGEVHDDGRIWSATLWEIHERVGRELADRLVYTTLTSLPQAAHFVNASQVLNATAAGLDTGNGELVRVTAEASDRTGLATWEPIVTLTGRHRIFLGGGNTGAFGPLSLKTRVAADGRAWVAMQRDDTSFAPSSERYRLYFSNERIPIGAPPTGRNLQGAVVLDLNEDNRFRAGDEVHILFENLTRQGGGFDDGSGWMEVATCQTRTTCPTEIVSPQPRSSVPTGPAVRDAGVEAGATDAAGAGVILGGGGCAVTRPTQPSLWVFFGFASAIQLILRRRRVGVNKERHRHA